MFKDVEIYNAVRDKAVVKFCYGDGRERTVEAHGLEIRSGGKHLLIGYQVDGDTRSDRTVGWRAFDIRRVSHFRRTEENFVDARRAPTTLEAGKLIGKYLNEGLSSEEIIRKLVDLGTPSAWVEEYLAGGQGRLIPLDATTKLDGLPEGRALHCSFCDRSAAETVDLILGRNGLICPECVKRCQDIMDDA